MQVNDGILNRIDKQLNRISDKLDDLSERVIRFDEKSKKLEEDITDLKIKVAKIERDEKENLASYKKWTISLASTMILAAASAVVSFFLGR